MGRSVRQIKQSLGDAVRTADPTADLDKGPVFDLMLAPVSNELSGVEQTIDNLRTLASLQLDRVATEPEINAIGTSFGLPPVTGRAAEYNQTFWTDTKPIQDIVIERGTLVGTADASRVYRVAERVVMLASSANAYLNSQRKRYEVTARIISTSIGTSSNLPAYRIKRFVTLVPGLTGTENQSGPTVLGTERQSNADYMTRIRRKFMGLSSQSAGSPATRITEYAPTIVTDVQLVYPKDRAVFRRDTGRPAIDAYIVGEQNDKTTQTMMGSGSETVIVLENQPVVSVERVVVDGETISGWTLSRDVGQSTGGTARAQDAVVLQNPLQSGQTCEITYTYDRLVMDLQQNLFGTDGDGFGTDILVRRPEKLLVTVKIQATILPSFDSNRALDSIRAVVFGYVQPNRFQQTMLPETLQQRIIGSVGGISALRIMRFTPTLRGTVPVESIVLQKNQLGTVDLETLSITTHQ